MKMEEFHEPPVLHSVVVFAIACAIVTDWKIFFAGLAFGAFFCAVRDRIRKKKREPTPKLKP